jgi:teichoic acid transport system permease protein
VSESKTRLARGGDPPEPPASLAQGGDPAEPPAGLSATLGESADGRLTAPGQLQSGEADFAGGITPAGVNLAAYAIEYGLQPSAERAPVFRYLRQLWRRRHFIMAFATARNMAMYTEAKLGQAWQILTPLMNAGVYFLIFGLLLHIDRGIPNYLGFLVTGVFVFNFTQRSFITTSNVMTDSLPLIRALQFPRASLPLAYVVIELQQMTLAMVVLVPILLITGEPVTWYWLLAIPVLLLQMAFNIGMGLLVARLGSQVNDFSQLLPFLMRTWLYVSGVLYSISTLDLKNYPWVVKLLQLNPAALYITLMRNALMLSQRDSTPGAQPYSLARCNQWKTLGHQLHEPKKYQFYSAYCHYYADPHSYWLWAIGWAALALVAGFWFFWRAETRYGRG